MKRSIKSNAINRPVRRRISAASESPTERLMRLISALMEEGVDEHEILKYIVQTLPTSTTYDMMKDLAYLCDLDPFELLDQYAYI